MKGCRNLIYSLRLRGVMLDSMRHLGIVEYLGNCFYVVCMYFDRSSGGDEVNGGGVREEPDAR